ncbi:hypothetical protein [Desertivirga arenae]|uniref:hypothetical protein n=1 Tax=Desertivirga arenae TaxID=2810309 RepID=UPI001A9740DF|nr:hypothetical protein [Pedobacter sp. SYSU D00823]
MTLFNLDKLENQLRKDQVTDRQAMIYLLINNLLYSLTIYFATGQKAKGWMFWTEILTVILSNGLGVYYSYVINKRGDNKDFFKRFQAIVFVLGLRLMVFVLLTMFVVGLLLNTPLDQPLPEMLFCIIFNSYFLIAFTASFRRISQPEDKVLLAELADSNGKEEVNEND